MAFFAVVTTAAQSRRYAPAASAPARKADYNSFPDSDVADVPPVDIDDEDEYVDASGDLGLPEDDDYTFGDDTYLVDTHRGGSSWG